MKMEAKRNTLLKFQPKEKFIRWATAIGFFYGSVGIALYYLQEKFLFHPEPLASDYVFKFNIPFKEINIAINERDTLNLIQFFPPTSTAKRRCIIFSWQHGKCNTL